MVEDAAHGYGNELSHNTFCTHKTKERKLPLAFFDQASTQAARTQQMYSTDHSTSWGTLKLDDDALPLAKRDPHA
jgi:hypothetical protein